MPDSSAERTEKATPKRREEARQKGNVARSIEVNSALVLFTGTILLALMAHSLFGNLSALMRDVFVHIAEFELNPTNIPHYAAMVFLFLVRVIGPLILAVLVVGVAANVFQFGFLLTGEPLKPDLKKINPVNGFKRMFSLRSIVELAKGIIKVIIVGLVIYVTLRNAAEQFLPLMDQEIGQIIGFLGSIMLKIALRASIALIILAALDYGYQRWDYERSLRMTKEEVKEELREHEGDPLVKGRIRSIQREIARRRMMSEVPKADVVITNPVHYAVALKYVAEEMSAPTVVAKGARKLAEKIKELARENDVPIVEDPPLARMLYKSCEVGEEIPVDLYQSVAEILAYVYQLKQKVS
jgi:flagellar biosynthetic protein FlhB